MPEYYTFRREEDADGIFYYFSSKTHVFAVSLTGETEEAYLNGFPNLLSQAYEFSFFSKVYHPQIKKTSDAAVKRTLFKIIETHFEEHGKETVLLYRCDTSDGKGEARNRLFEMWSSADDCYVKDFLLLESVEVELPMENGSKKIYYIGFITHKGNPNIKSVREEFDSFIFILPLFAKG